MSSIKEVILTAEEAKVLKFALSKVLPHFQAVVDDASGDRKHLAVNNLESAKDMLKDIESQVA